MATVAGLRADDNGFQWIPPLASETLRLEVKSSVLWITMARPRRLNAMNRHLIRDLAALFELLATPQGASVRAVVLTGEGRGFCSGADLKSQVGRDGEAATWDATLYEYQRAFSRVVQRVREAPQLVVAAINGTAVGGGFSLALAADVRFAVKGARMRANFPQIGLTGCELGTSYMLPRLVGVGRAMEILTTTEELVAGSERAAGLLNGVSVTQEHLYEDVTVFLNKALTACSGLGLRLTKEGVYAGMDATSFAQALRLEDRQQALCLNRDDCRAHAASHVARIAMRAATAAKGGTQPRSRL